MKEEFIFDALAVVFLVGAFAITFMIMACIVYGPWLWLMYMGLLSF